MSDLYLLHAKPFDSSRVGQGQASPRLVRRLHRLFESQKGNAGFFQTFGRIDRAFENARPERLQR